MNAIAFFWHFLGLLAPALFLGSALAAAARWLWMPRLPFILCAALNTLAAALALIAGLVLSGHDGKISSYAAAILAAASVQYFALHKTKNTHKKTQ